MGLLPSAPFPPHYFPNAKDSCELCIYLVEGLQNLTLQSSIPCDLLNTVDHRVRQLKLEKLANFYSSVVSPKFLGEGSLCDINLIYRCFYL